jgi:mRNA-degrading endonuclease toxin of MazEF toxin-antitoxin module
MISDKDKLSKSLGDSIMKVKMQEALQKYKERLEKQQLEKANEKKEKHTSS